MTVFIDTSAVFDVLHRGTQRHERAASEWRRLVSGSERLRTHSYVVGETVALVQARLGLGAVRAYVDDVVPALSVRWVDEALHGRAVTALLAANNRALSLVDWASFEMMREERIGEAFAFDDDFAKQGYEIVP